MFATILFLIFGVIVLLGCWTIANEDRRFINSKKHWTPAIDQEKSAGVTNKHQPGPR